MLGILMLIAIVVAGLWAYNKWFAKTPCGCKE